MGLPRMGDLARSCYDSTKYYYKEDGVVGSVLELGNIFRQHFKLLHDPFAL